MKNKSKLVSFALMSLLLCNTASCKSNNITTEEQTTSTTESSSTSSVMHSFSTIVLGGKATLQYQNAYKENSLATLRITPENKNMYISAMLSSDAIPVTEMQVVYDKPTHTYSFNKFVTQDLIITITLSDSLSDGYYEGKYYKNSRIDMFKNVITLGDLASSYTEFDSGTGSLTDPLIVSKDTNLNSMSNSTIGKDLNILYNVENEDTSFSTKTRQLIEDITTNSININLNFDGTKEITGGGFKVNTSNLNIAYSRTIYRDKCKIVFKGETELSNPEDIAYLFDKQRAQTSQLNTNSDTTITLTNFTIYNETINLKNGFININNNDKVNLALSEFSYKNNSNNADSEAYGINLQDNKDKATVSLFRADIDLNNDVTGLKKTNSAFIADNEAIGTYTFINSTITSSNAITINENESNFTFNKTNFAIINRPEDKQTKQRAIIIKGSGNELKLDSCNFKLTNKEGYQDISAIAILNNAEQNTINFSSSKFSTTSIEKYEIAHSSDNSLLNNSFSIDSTLLKNDVKLTEAKQDTTYSYTIENPSARDIFSLYYIDVNDTKTQLDDVSVSSFTPDNRIKELHLSYKISEDELASFVYYF